MIKKYDQEKYRIQNVDISFLELWNVLVRRRLILVFVFFAVSISVVLFSIYRKPIFKSNIILSKSYYSGFFEVESLYEFGGGIYNTPIDKLFDEFLNNIQKNNLRRMFANKYGEKADSSRIKEMLASIKVKYPGRFNKNGIVTATAQSPNNKIVSVYFPLFLKFAHRIVVDDYLSALKVEVLAQQQAMVRLLDEARYSALLERKNRIEVLKEASSIAEQLGIYEVFDSNVLNGNVIDSNPPLYVRGVRALNEEINALEKRVSDDPFSEDILKIEERMKFLNDFHIVPENVIVAYINDSSIINKTKQMRIKIIVLGLIGGGLLSILVSFVVDLLFRITSGSTYAD